MVIPCASGRSSLTHVAVVIAAIWLLAFAAEPAFAVEFPEGAAPAAAEAVESSSPREPGTAHPLQKSRLLTFAFVMLGCIIVGGALLLALVVIWGNRARRLAQSPLPPIAKRDELWFLKPKKEGADGTGGDAPGDPGQETGPEE